MIYSALGMVIRGHTIYQYGTAYDQSHGLKRTNNPGGQIIWTEQRLDGFVSAEAAYGGGELITKPVVRHRQSPGTQYRRIGQRRGPG